MVTKKPHFARRHRIAIIGAGPAGIHMASLLKRRGYRNVTVFEQTGRVGGKSYTIVKDGAPHEMGTCFLHNGYRRTRGLVAAYGLRPGIAFEGRAMFSGAYDDRRSLDFDDFIGRKIVADWRRRHPRRSRLPAGLIKSNAVWCLLRYANIYRRIFGAWRLPYAIPFDLGPEALQRLDMTFLEFLQRNRLDPLIECLRMGQASQGYGYLESVPAYYGLCWNTPDLLWGIVTQALGLRTFLRMLPEGFGTLWRTIADTDGLSVRLNATIHGIDRSGSGGVRIDCAVAGEKRQVEVYDFLVLAINLRDALRLLHDATAVEQKLFGVLRRFTLTATLYESDPMPGYSTPDEDRKIAYFPDLLRPGLDTVWYADRHDRHIFAKANGLTKRFNRQVRVAFQFSEKDSAGADGVAVPFRQDARIAAKLEESWARFGVGNPRVITQCSWPFFSHFPQAAISGGCLNELFASQGQRRTWYAGASASFESVEHVIGYNHALVDTYL